MACMDEVNINLFLPQPINGLLDHARKRGKGHFSPTVAAAIYSYYKMNDADGREKIWDEYSAWMEIQIGKAGDSDVARNKVLRARQQAQPRTTPKTKKA